MIVDAVTAKVQQLREKYEEQGYQVIERPGPEEFPFDAGYHDWYRPAMLARRGSENLVFEVREEARLLGHRLFDRSDTIRQHPDWHFYLVTLDDVVPFDAPGVQGDPPEWPQLEHRVEAALRLRETGASHDVLLALWSALEGVLRRMAVDEGIPVDRLPASLLINALYDRGFIPFDSYEPLWKALEVHRRVLHGYDAPDDRLAQAVHDVMEVLPQLFADHLQHA